MALQSLDNALLSGSGAPPSMIAFEASLAAALAAGAELAAEQQAVLDIRLSVEYMKGLDSETQEDMEVWRQQWQQAREEREARRRAAAEAAEVVREAAAAAVRQAAAERAAAAAAEAAATAAAGGPSVEQQHGQEEEQEEEAEQAAAQAATPSGLPACTPDELAAALRDRSVVAIDVRSARDWDWGRIKGAAHAPYAVTSGSSLAPEVGPGWEQGGGPWDASALHLLSLWCVWLTGRPPPLAKPAAQAAPWPSWPRSCTLCSLDPAWSALLPARCRCVPTPTSSRRQPRCWARPAPRAPRCSTAREPPWMPTPAPLLLARRRL